MYKSKVIFRTELSELSFCEYKVDVLIKYLFNIKILCNVVKTKWRYETNPRGSAGYARKAPSLFLGPLNKPNASYVKMLR